MCDVQPLCNINKLHEMFDDRDQRQSELWVGLRRVSEMCSCSGASESICNTCRSSWSWTSGSSMAWSNWIPREPGPSECGRLVNNGWAEYECTAKYRFICERGSTYSCELTHFVKENVNLLVVHRPQYGVFYNFRACRM